MSELSIWEVEAILELLHKIQEGEDVLLLEEEIDECIHALQISIGEVPHE